MSTGLALFLSAILIVVNGFFVAVEIAFVASRRTKLQTLAEEGAAGAKAALTATVNVTKMLFAAQLGITVASLILGFIAEATVAHLIESAIESIVHIPEGVLHAIGFVTALLLVVFVHTVFGEMVPKNIVLTAPETASRFLAPVHLVVVAAVRPIIWVLAMMARPLLRMAGVSPDRNLGEAHTPQELVRMIDAAHAGGLVEEQERALLTGALDFGDAKVASIMIPVADMVTVDRATPIREIERTVLQTGHSRLPVVEPDGSINGFVHSKDLLRLPEESQGEIAPQARIRRMLQVDPDRDLEDVLLEMNRQRTHMAVVASSAGDVVGMITLEDVVEAIVGEIFDESDA